MTIKQFIAKAKKKGCNVKVNNIAKAKDIHKISSKVKTTKNISFSKLIER